MTHEYYVYIMASKTGAIYIGVTRDLVRRVFEHKNRLVPGFTCRYGIDRLVFYESCGDVTSVIRREKELKGWRRSKKVELVESTNPTLRDLAQDWSGATCHSERSEESWVPETGTRRSL